MIVFFLPGDYELYEKISLGIARAVSGYGDAFEQTSIDEFTLDISSAGNYRKAETIAKQIKKAISGKYKLTCSIGIGPNRLIAKMASDFRKPDGINVVDVNMKAHTTSRTLSHPTQDFETIKKAVVELYVELLGEAEFPLRLGEFG